MVTSDLLVVLYPTRDAWRSVKTRPGALCVIMHGILLMLLWLADNWDSLEQVNILFSCLFFFIFVAVVVLHFRYYKTSDVTAFTNAVFGPGNGAIVLDNVACTGLEERLVNCPYDNHTADCFHSEDAGVYCSNITCMSLAYDFLKFPKRCEVLVRPHF